MTSTLRNPLSDLSLHALRGFEATVRTESFTAAAAELDISVSAASRLVRNLERELGVTLLRKDGRGVRPTATGEALAAGLAAGFTEIARAVAGALARRPRRQVALSTLPTFAMRWLIPRLGDFEQRHPGIAVRIEASAAIADLARGDVQAAVRYGRGGWRGLLAVPLFEERLVVVAAPIVTQGTRPPAAELVRRLPLLVSRPRPGDWPAWFRAAGLDPAEFHPAHEFEGQTYVIEAVLAGRGVGLVDEELIGLELAGGALVRMSDVALVTGERFWLARHRDVEPTAELTAFWDWLVGAARASGRHARLPIHLAAGDRAR